MTALFRFVLVPYFVEVYCAFIALVFATTLLFWQRGSSKLKKDLKLVGARLTKFNEPTAFADEFESYAKDASQRFPHLWNRYRDAALITPPASSAGEEKESNRSILSTASARQYINDAAVVAFALPIHVYSAMPNILTGLGILGTFLGLAGGIDQATAGITSPDTAAIRDSLSDLLDGAALAFVTSIVGVLFSIVFLFLMRRRLGTITRLTDRWARGLDQLTEPSTPTRIAYDHLKEAKKASGAMQSFSTDVAAAIGKQLDAFRQDRAQDSTKVIEDALKEFAKVLERQTGDQFGGLAKTVGQLNTSLAASARRFEETQSSVNDMVTSLGSKVQALMKDSANTISDVAEKASHDMAEQLTSATSDMLKRMDDKLTSITTDLARAGAVAAGNISDSSAHLETAASGLARSVAQSEKMLNQVTQAVEDFDLLHKAIGEASHEVRAVVAPLQRATTTIQASVNRTAVVLEDTEGLIRRIENSTQELRTHNETIAGVWQQYQERFKDVDQSLARVFTDMSKSLASYSDQVTKFAKQLDATAGEAIEKLSAATGELSSSIEDLIDGLHEVRDT